jgi:peptide/nickel transport system substrate-binding protein
MRTVALGTRLLGALAIGAMGVALARSKEPLDTAPLRIAHEARVISLDPVAVSEAATQSVLSNFYEGLVAFDQDMKLVPALAVTWSTPEENAWVFRIREGVRFHDGSVLTATDAAFSLERARSDPHSQVRGQLKGVRAISVLGPGSLRIETLRPDALLVNRLAYVLLAPQRSAAGLSEHPIGTGPYRFAGRRAGVIEAEAFASYWGGPPAIPRVEFSGIEDGRARIRALREGRVDVLRYVPPTLARELASEAGVGLVRRPGLTSVYLWLDSRPGPGGSPNPFADPRVRRALSLAIDRRAFVARLDGMPSAANQLVAPGVFGHVRGAPALPHDPDAARALLAAAGHPHGIDLRLVHAEGAPAEAMAAEVVAEMLAPVGVRARVEAMDWPRMVAAWGGGRLPAFVSGWRFENGDALSFFQDCLRSREPKAGLGSFNPGFSDPRLDRLIEETLLVSGPAARLRRYRELTELAVQQMPLVPLYSQQDIYARAASVRWQPRLDAKLLAVEMARR